MRNCWSNAAAPAVGIHLSIGSVYAWSVFTIPVMQAMNVSLREVQWTFSIAILFLGLSAAFLGQFVERRGPCLSGLICAALFGAGMMGAGYAVQTQSLWLLYATYGVIGGIGLGIGYITPVSTLVKWFPKRKGLATGLAIMGFGFASLIAGPVIQALIAEVGLVKTFYALGGLYTAIIFISALNLAPPIVSLEFVHKVDDHTVEEAMKTWQFYALWFMLFVNITAGIALISVASPMLQEMTHVSAATAATIVGIIGVFNGLGRFLWATASDYLGRPNTYVTFFAIQLAAFMWLTHAGNALVFQLLLYLIMTTYGGGFACIPAYLSDLYGDRQISAIHGRILTAWAAAGIAGPIITAQIKELTNSYAAVLMIFAGLFVPALIISLYLKSKLTLNYGRIETNG